MGRILCIPLALLILLAGAMVWSGETARRRADLTYINRGDVNTLDLTRMSWAQDIRLAYALWEGLYTLDPETLEPVPGAASSCDISEDGMVYTFHLRPDGRWTNGDPVVAGDFIFSWRRILESPDEYSHLFHCIVGARDYQNRFAEPSRDRPADFDSVEMKALDDLTLQVKLVQPTAYFLGLTAFPAFFPSHEESMRAFAHILPTGRTQYHESYTHPPHLVTNGPYRLTEWAFRRHVRVEASEHYWNREAVKPKIIDQIACEDPLAMYLMYHSGAVDWLLQVDANIASELLARHDPDLHVSPGFGTYFYSINCQPTFSDGTPNPFHDVRVRQAFAMTIDKQPVVDLVTRTGEPTTDNYIPPGIFLNYPTPEGLARDTRRARELLKEAGYPNGAGLPRITLIYNNGSHHADVAQIIRRQWLDELGVDVELQGMELARFRERLNKKEYMIARASWIGDYNDPTTFLDKYHSTSHGNDAGWVNERYDRLLDSAAAETDAGKRLALLSQAEGVLNRDAPIIPVFVYTNAFLYRPNIRGINLRPQGLFVYHTISVEDDRANTDSNP